MRRVDASIEVLNPRRNGNSGNAKIPVSIRDSGVPEGRKALHWLAGMATMAATEQVGIPFAMHETAIVTGLMRILEEKAAAHGVARILRVTLKVGRLRAVEPAQLRACFEMFAEGTVADGAELSIDEVAVRGRCKVCGGEFEVLRYRFDCSVCGGGDVEVVAGQELYIESFDAGS